MDLFMIRRNKGWKTGEELEAAAKRSTEVAESDFPDEIRWIRSYVVAEASGELGTVCIYEASEPTPSAATPTRSGCRPTRCCRSSTPCSCARTRNRSRRLRRHTRSGRAL